MKAPKTLIALAILAALGIGVVFLNGAKQNALLVTNVVAAPIDGEPGVAAIYANIENKGGPDRLMAARSIVSKRAQLSSSVADAGLPIPANGTPSLAADGAYIRLDGVGGDLKDGRTIPVTLRFENAGDLNLRARLAAPQASGQASAFGLFGLGDICRVEEGEPAPEITLSVTPDEDGWLVRIDAQDFTFSQDMVDGPHVPGTGHGHLYLGGLKLQRLYEPEARIGALPSGTHEVRVTLNTNDHRAYVVGETPVTASAVIQVP